MNRIRRKLYTKYIRYHTILLSWFCSSQCRDCINTSAYCTSCPAEQFLDNATHTCVPDCNGKYLMKGANAIRLSGSDEPFKGRVEVSDSSCDGFFSFLLHFSPQNACCGIDLCGKFCDVRVPTIWRLSELLLRQLRWRVTEKCMVLCALYGIGCVMSNTCSQRNLYPKGGGWGKRLMAPIFGLLTSIVCWLPAFFSTFHFFFLVCGLSCPWSPFIPVLRGWWH